VEVRPVRADEHGQAGDVVVAAYRALPGAHLSGGYATLLADVARRSTEAEVLVAVGTVVERGREEIVGCVTYVPDHASPWSELLEAGEAGIRMLAVRPDAQGRGTGRALVDACVVRARSSGRGALMLHTTPWMKAAHRLYEDVGFVRFPERDWTPEPDVPLLAYRLELGAAAG
jgi:GNAT superfamily N-acetyltransferase